MLKEKAKDLKSCIEIVLDFPIPGVSFKDVTPLLRDHFKETIDALEALYTPAEWEKVDYLTGIEARGFVFASALAERLGKGLVLIRKEGKLPGKTMRVESKLEYGSAVLEMYSGQGNLLIVDDVLATGGTLKHSAELATQVGYEVVGFLVLINLVYLNQFSWNGITARAAIEFSE
jgi:adenine phosphoribosyltransferase